jgi:hypothetical protein
MKTTVQLATAASLEGFAGDLQQIVRELLFKTHVSSAPLQNLARRIQLDVMTAADTSELLARGATRDITLPRSDWRSEPAVYTRGLCTAQLLAYAAPRMFGWSDRTELLVIAALLQDIGLLLLERQYNLRSEQLADAEPDAYQQHPNLSAAVAGAIEDYAVDLPTIIAQHHERSDGTGFPTGLRSNQLSAPSRLLAIATRYIELTDEPAANDSSASPSESATIVAGQLWREAKQGELDALLTADLLRQLGLDVPAEERPALGRRFQLSRFGQKQFRRDDAVRENAVEGPHGNQQRDRNGATEERETTVRR